MYYIGIDGSGQYSRLVAVDGDLNTLGRHGGKCLSLSINSMATVVENLKTLVVEFGALNRRITEDCGGIAIGGSLLELPKNRDAFKKLWAETGITSPVFAISEYEMFLASETNGDDGIVIISGVDSVGYAVKFGEETIKSGGYGHMIDSGGSAYRMGMEAIRKSLYSWDGRGEHTTLAPQVMKHFDATDFDSIANWLNSKQFNRVKVSELALMVKYAALEKDRAAVAIEDEAAEELFLIADSLITKSSLTACKLVLSGSTLMFNEGLRSKFSSKVRGKHPEIDIVLMMQKPEMGAAYLAKKRAALA